MNFLKGQEFTSDYLTLGNQIVQSTLQIYNAAANSLLPTPAKSHCKSLLLKAKTEKENNF